MAGVWAEDLHNVGNLVYGVAVGLHSIVAARRANVISWNGVQGLARHNHPPF